MTTGIYNRMKMSIASGQLVLATADLRVLLVASGYVFDPDHDFVSDLTNELSGTGYLRQALANKIVVEDDVADRIKFDADDVTWNGANFTGGAVDSAIIYVEATNDNARQLVCSIDINPKLVTSGVNYTLSWGANGILLLA